jgi:hypothetical protein
MSAYFSSIFFAGGKAMLRGSADFTEEIVALIVARI